MPRVAAAFALLMLLAQCGRAAPQQDFVLTLPHPLQAQERAYIEVTLGAIGSGQEIDVTTADGQELGVISPHGIRLGQAAGTYTLPVPTTAIRRDRIAIRLSVTRAGAAPRTPTPQELRDVKLVLEAGSP